MSISAFVTVYNEEKRIGYTLQSLQWCDEIVVMDKESTDRTREIAESYGARVYTAPYSDTYVTNEVDYLLKYCNSEWLIWFTASDIIHPKLAAQIKEITDRADFPYDFLHIPFQNYVLGINRKRSPWHIELKAYVYRKSAIAKNEGGVHDALAFKSDRRYMMKPSDKYCVYHLTHESVDGMMNRHLRYLRGEAAGYDEPSLKPAFKIVKREIYNTLVHRRTYLLGWDGVMLMFAYISYFMIGFMYKWEKKRSASHQIYQALREDISKAWSEQVPAKGTEVR